MEISLKDSLLIYSERFPEGHPLKEIALTTLTELGRTNPFGREKQIDRTKEYQIYNVASNTHYRSISDACYSLGQRGSEARNELRRVLKKYDLKLI